MTNWQKHFYEQFINKGNYDPVDQTVLEELFRMLVWEIDYTDEGGLWIGSEEKINNYVEVIKDFLIIVHIDLFDKIVEDMKRELLQEVPPTQAEEGEG